MNKIFNKIFGIYLLVLIPLTSVILFITFDIIHDHYIGTITTDLKGLNYVIQEQIRGELKNDDINILRNTVKKLAKKSNSRITVISSRGVVLADTEEDPQKMENHAARVEIAQALSGKMGSSLRFSKTVEKKMLYVALPIYKSNELLGVSRVSLYVNYVDELYSELRNKILIATLIIMFLSLVILFAFSKNITNPLKDLVNASQRFSAGDFNTKVIIDNKDELRELADNFNSMTEKISNLFDEKSMQQEELKRIIGSMQEGLIVLDKDNKIVLHNKSFKKTVNTNDIDNKNYWEILRDINVQNLVEKVRKKKSHKSTEIKLDDVFYLCSANYIQTKDEIVIVLFDISERKQIEDMKRDFIVNASHELRTPLTAIQGFIDTMEDDFKDEGRDLKYLEIIKRHTSRLVLIVEDLLTISKLEDEKVDLHLTDIDFNDILADIMPLFSERLEESGIKLKSSVDEEVKDYRGDHFKIEQLFINLIDNALKYTQAGKIQIDVTDDEDSIIINVTDTGIGIPPSDLNRIFERFYTVEKSRSRKVGGTGLGLSIVKHIVNLHQGTIDVESKPGIGSTFTVRLPKELTAQ